MLRGSIQCRSRFHWRKLSPASMRRRKVCGSRSCLVDVVAGRTLSTQNMRGYWAHSSQTHISSINMGCQKRFFAAGGSPASDDTETYPFLLADIGEGIREVELIEWCISPGQTVKQFEKVCVVQSDKATVEITSRYDGVIDRLCGQPGEMIFVGEPLLFLQGESVADGDTRALTEVVKDEVVAEVGADNSDSASDSSSESAEAPRMGDGIMQQKVLTSPAVRKMAKEYSIDLLLVQATGPKGRVLKKDVLDFISEKENSASSAARPSRASNIAGETITLQGMGRYMAKSMTESLGIPQMGIGDDIVLNSLSNYKKELKESGTQISTLAFFLKACSLSLNEHPLVNSRIKGNIMEDFKVEVLPHHDLGIAMDTERGLVVPVIQRVESLSILEIQQEIDRLKYAARGGGIGMEDLATPSFTLSNVGSLGVGTSLQPVLGPPQVAMGAMGRIQALPRFNNDGDVVPTPIMHVSWVGDHRVLDGATLARFHVTFARYISNPMNMLLELK